MRVAYSLFSQNNGAELAEFRNLAQMLPMGFGDDMLHFNGIGERITAATYNNDAPSEEAKEKFYAIIRWAAQQGLTLTIHWQENKSVGQLLDLFERVNRETPITGLRWSIAHLNDSSAATFERMKALGVGWTMQDAMYFQGDQELARRGEAARRMPPIMTALRTGVQVGAGTDAHGPDETPTREQALRLYTLGSAWFSFDDNKRGSLEVGKLADFAILDRDYFSVPAGEIARIESVMTVVGGKVVFTARPLALKRECLLTKNVAAIQSNRFGAILLGDVSARVHRSWPRCVHEVSRNASRLSIRIG